VSEVSTRVRLSVIGVIIAALFAGLLARLWFLQVGSPDTAAAQTQANRLRTVIDPGVRGSILDRNGTVLVSNRLVDTIEIQRGLKPAQLNKTVHNLAVLFSVPDAAVWKSVNNNKVAAYQSIPVKDDVPYDTLVYVKERPEDFPGVIATQRSVRTYTHGGLAANLLGYVGAVNAQDLKVHQGEGYTANDVIGKDGVEQVFENELRGSPHIEKFEVDSRGRIVTVLKNQRAKAGNNIQLSLDANIQAEAENALAQGIAEVRTRTDTAVNAGNKLFAGTGGAAVVLDARDGSVVAMASNPSYPVDQFTNGIPANLFSTFTQPGSNFPLLNRATQGLYPPGSTFKLLTAIAALEHPQAVPPGLTFADNGCLHFGNPPQEFCNAGKTPHGIVNLAKAIEVSSDVYFYNVGFLFWRSFVGNAPKGIKPDMTDGYGIQTTARAFGFGRPTGVGLPQEASGRIPDLKFKLAVNKTNPDPYSRTWLPGDSANVATGQGDVLVTPLQLADAYAAFENGGTLYSPRLATAVKSPGGGTTVRNLPAALEGKTGLTPAIRSALMPGLAGAVSASDGTASGAFNGYSGLPIAGKTGTAQQPPPTQDTSWFVGMVNPDPPPNSNQPQYVVVVTVEQAGFGGTVAAPIARRIIEALNGNLNPAPVEIAPPTND
jgi:penicillin-binding protein 2